MSAAESGKEITIVKKESTGDPTRVWCKECELTFHWSNRAATPCVVCAHVTANITGTTMGEKRNTFLAMSINEALKHDHKVPKSWSVQYIRARVVSLFEHWKKLGAGSSIKLLSGKSGLMQLQEMCRTSASTKELAATLDGLFLRGEHLAPCFTTLHTKCLASEWKEKSYTWVHALAPRILDVWNAHPDANVFSTDTHAYSVFSCYYQNMGEYANQPPASFQALFNHWSGTIERKLT